MRAQLNYALAALAGLLGATLAYAEPNNNLNYESAFEHYEAYKPAQKRDWKWANDNVGKIGGWQFYAKEAYEQSKKDGNSAAPAMNHGNHGMRHGSQGMPHDMSNMKDMPMDHSGHGMNHGDNHQGGHQ